MNKIRGGNQLSIEYKRGNIFSSTAPYKVNPVNLRGVMGGGLAKVFRDLSPSMYKKYRESCLRGDFKIGDIQVLDMSQGSGTLYAVNFPTKDHYNNPSELSYIEKGLQTFVQEYEEIGITHIAFPKLGCGLGGLSWEEVKLLMEHYLGNLPNIRVEIYV